MKLPEPPLSASEIAAMVYDSGHIRDRGNAQRLETRITDYGAAKGTEGQAQGIAKAAKVAHNALAAIKGANNRAAASRVVRAIDSLLPTSEKTKEAYALGYKDGTEDTLKKFSRDDTGPRSR